MMSTGIPVRILVYEHITGGAFAPSAIPPGLAAQGQRMLACLISDLARAGADVVTTRAASLPAVDWPAEVRLVQGPRSWPGAWRDVLADCQACWPIAPETDGLLATLSRDVQAAGRCLLGPEPGTVAACASKLTASRRLRRAGVPTVPTWPLAEGAVPFGPPWVVKPDDGAGCEHTRVVGRRSRLADVLREYPPGVAAVAQPWVEGTAASLSLVCEDGRAELLAFNRQDVRMEGDTLRFLGTRFDPGASAAGRHLGLANRVARAFPGLRGYVGVDLLETETGPRVLEVNPRLTTAYCGLSGALGRNVAERVLRCFMPRGEVAGRVA